MQGSIPGSLHSERAEASPLGLFHPCAIEFAEENGEDDICEGAALETILTPHCPLSHPTTHIRSTYLQEGPL